MPKPSTVKSGRMFGGIEPEEQRAEHWKEIGARIREARGDWSQQAVADAIEEQRPKRKRTRAAIAQYEAGTNPPSFQTIYDLANVLNVSADFLLTGETPESLGQGATRVSWKDKVKQAEKFMLPSSLIKEFGIGDVDIQFFRLALDAGTLGAQVGDYLIVDVGVTDITADGDLYVLDSPRGPSIARAEAVGLGADTVVLTTGKGMPIMTAKGSVKTRGRVVAVIKCLIRN